MHGTDQSPVFDFDPPPEPAPNGGDKEGGSSSPDPDPAPKPGRRNGATPPAPPVEPPATVTEHSVKQLIKLCSPQQLRFVLAGALRSDWDGAARARVAGYSPRSARQRSYDVMRATHVAELCALIESDRQGGAHPGLQTGGMPTEASRELLERYWLRVMFDRNRPPRERDGAVRALAELHGFCRPKGADATAGAGDLLGALIQGIQARPVGLPGSDIPPHPHGTGSSVLGGLPGEGSGQAPAWPGGNLGPPPAMDGGTAGAVAGGDGEGTAT